MVVLIDKVARRLAGIWHRFITCAAMRKRMKNCGSNVSFGRNCDITCEGVSIGDNVYLGPNTRIISTRAEVKIGSNVMFGPGVTIITGNHRTDLVGRTMISVTNEEKRLEDDQDVIIEDDVWIGANATILKGVTIPTGSIVAAGAVVVSSPAAGPCVILGGVPARVIGYRFLGADLDNHLTIMDKVQ